MWRSDILFGVISVLALYINISLAENSGPLPPLTPGEVAALNAAAPAQEIRILTINVWSGLNYQGTFSIGTHRDNAQERYELLVEEIRSLNPDIIAVQEANPLPYYAERLAKDIDYSVACSVALGGIRFGPVGLPVNLREGDAILLKKCWTLGHLRSRYLAGCGIATNRFCFHFSEITQCLLTRAVVNGKPLYIYAVHLHSGPFRGGALDEAMQRLSREMPQEKLKEALQGVEEDIRRRKREIAALMEFIDRTLPEGAPAVLLGDFNTTVESGELDPLLADGRWADTFRLANPENEGKTWDPVRNPNFRQSQKSTGPCEVLRSHHERQSYRIDFVFATNMLSDRVVESRVVLEPEDGVAASDHYGVLTTLRW